MGHWRWSVGASQEVGQAGDNADSHLRLNLLQGLAEDAHVAAGKHLSMLEIGGGSATGLVNMTLNV